MTLPHRYGPHYHWVSTPFLSTLLAKVCSEDCQQPALNRLVQELYSGLFQAVLGREFPHRDIKVPTRMTESHPEIMLETQALNPKQPTVVVNLARAGTWPSHILYDTLNYTLNPQNVRQDHIFAARKVSEQQQITGTDLLTYKIGGEIDDAIVFFPDPMGATGSTLLAALDLYKNKVGGTARKYIALHLIVTPEYLKAVKAHHPDLVVYFIRVDRGLSPADILETVPGTHWDLERGLNEHQYIVPGGGGLGEVLNNSYA